VEQIISNAHYGNGLSWEFRFNAFGCLELNDFFRYEVRLFFQQIDCRGFLHSVRQGRAGHGWLDKNNQGILEQDLLEKRYTR